LPFKTVLPPLARALADRNFDKATPVQTAILADDVGGRDLLVSAQTGSGKTVAYGLAIANELLEGADRLPRAGAPLALVVAPTRELALQVCRELEWLYQYTGARVVSCVGGMDPRAEGRELAHGAHIVVGTPGRLCDHLRRGRLDVSELKAVVLDEADEMLDMGFREDMEFILETTPETRRTLLFSATLPKGIAALADKFQNDAQRIEVGGDDGGHIDIEYRAMRVATHEVENVVVNVLRFFEAPGAIVFCNTRHAVRHLQASLQERGFSVVALSGELAQHERAQALQALRDGRARVCVATDVAARGIDLPNIGLVIHAELPNDPEVLQHRSGRTGRAGKKGVSVLLIPPARRKRAEFLFRLAGIDVSWDAPPTADEIRTLDQKRMLQDALFAEAPSEDDLVWARALLEGRTAEEIAAALARLYRSKLPSPEETADPGESFERSRKERGRDRNTREERDQDQGPRPKRDREAAPKGARVPMQGGVWFSAAIGRKKNAEARWLLPMICRRGGIDKSDIGAIRIFDTTTEFEVSAEAAEDFAAKIKRPDKEDNIRLERLKGEPQRYVAPERSERTERFERKPAYRGDARRDDRGEGKRDEGKPRGSYRDEKRADRGAPSGDKPKFEKKFGKKFDKKFDKKGKPGGYDAPPKRDFGKKPKKKKF
jgi:ATP-dependent RNA helicase DeaD